MTRREFRSLDSPEAAREAIDALSIAPSSTETSLLDAQGSVLAERVDAPLDVPGFDRAAMDGYAVRARDTFGASGTDPETLPVLGRVHAGTAPETTLDTAAAIEIATGAVIPTGADAVVPVEQTAEEDDTVEIRAAVTPGENVMFRGDDIASGDRALGPGTRLSSRHIGLLAALGRETVTVQAPPTVGVVSTGAELVQPGTPLDHSAGQIYDVNSYSIASAVRAAGAEPRLYESTTDDRAEIESVLTSAAAECDLLLTSGSTSAGSSDLLYRLLDEAGDTLVHGVAVKPGRPLLIGRLFDTPYVGLPGYPVSALMTFTEFVEPRIRGVTAVKAETRAGESRRTTAEMRTRVRYEEGRMRLLAVGLVGDGNNGLVAYAPTKGSGATTTLAETDGFVRMEPETTLLGPGATVSVERFDRNEPVPSLLGVGEPDPVVFSALDTLSMPRFLRFGERDARRWFDDDIPDILVTVENDAGGQATTGETASESDSPGEEIAAWQRNWGIVVSPDRADDIGGVDSLAVENIQFANLDSDISVRSALETALASADVSGDDIEGYNRELPGLESATQSVATGRADAGLGLEQGAVSYGLEFVHVGSQTVRVTVAPPRQSKTGVQQFVQTLQQSLPDRLAEMPGYAATE
jgi:putative molybdopterin biosynthesis protein